jgi:ABC-type transport system substrate-binding protein
MELLNDIHQAYPIISVGVRQLATSIAKEDWAQRRVARLLDRTLIDASDMHQDATQVSFTLNDQLVEGKRFTAFDVQAALSNRAVKVSGQFDPAWHALDPQIRALDNLTIELQMHTGLTPPVLRLLQVPIRPQPLFAEQSSGPVALGAYHEVARQFNEVRYELFPDGVAEPGQPARVVERKFTSLLAAARALRDGEIVALDRVEPWELETLENYQAIEVEPYAGPTIHFLVPNVHQLPMAETDLRRAVLLGINRENVLTNAFSTDPESPLAAPLATPFPLGYAGERMDGRDGYQPRLAAALASLAWQHCRSLDPKLPNRPTLTLVIPASDSARRAAQAIQQQLDMNGQGIVINIQVEESTDMGNSDRAVAVNMEVASPKGSMESGDLRLVEWHDMEPFIDVYRLFSNHDVARSPTIDAILRELPQAATLEKGGSLLRDLARDARDEALIIPLWQFPEYLAYRKTLEGMGARPVTLYHNLENWRHPAYIEP